jgi:hypothetical protein
VAAAANAQVFGPGELSETAAPELLTQADAVRAGLRSGLSRWARLRSDVSLRPFFDRRDKVTTEPRPTRRFAIPSLRRTVSS